MGRARDAWRDEKFVEGGGDERGDSVDAETISPRGKSDAPQRESFPQRGVTETVKIVWRRVEESGRPRGRSYLSGCRSRSRLL